MRTLALGVLVAFFTIACGQVGPGERATFTTWGKLEQKCYPPGLYFYNPISTDMDELDVRVQRYEVKKAGAASRDLQEIHADVVVNFSIDGEKCYELVQQVGWDFKHRVIDPGIQEVLKASTAHFPIEKVIQERAQLKEEILKGLRGRLAQYFITVQDVALTNFDFSPAFVKAVEDKQIQEQNVTRKEYEKQQAEKEAQKTIALAHGDAQAILLKANAQAQGNRAVRESLSKELIEFTAIQTWDGKLPQVSGGAVPFINLGERK